MENEIKEISTNFYHHIDNGGPEIKFLTRCHESETIEESTTFITLQSTYMGYPSVSANIGHLTLDNLKELRRLLTEHIAKMELEIK